MLQKHISDYPVADAVLDVKPNTDPRVSSRVLK